MRGEEVAHDVDTELSFDVEALLPEDYVTDVGVRLSLYKRLASAVDEGHVDRDRGRDGGPLRRAARGGATPRQAHGAQDRAAPPARSRLRGQRPRRDAAPARRHAARSREDHRVDPQVRRRLEAHAGHAPLATLRRAATGSRTPRPLSPSSRTSSATDADPRAALPASRSPPSRTDGKAGRMIGWASHPPRPPFRPRRIQVGVSLRAVESSAPGGRRASRARITVGRR